MIAEREDRCDDRAALPARPWRIYLLVGAVGLITISFLVYGWRKGVRMTSAHTQWANAVTAIKLDTTLAHLWLEEILSGDSQKNITTVWSLLDEAESHTRVILDGVDRAVMTAPGPNGRTLDESAEALRQKLNELRVIGQRRFDARATSRPGTESDKQFDAVFGETLARADRVGAGLQHFAAQDLSRFESTQIILIGVCGLLTITVGVAFHRFERRRTTMLVAFRDAESALSTEVSERNQAQAQLRLRVAALDAAADAVMITDHKGLIVWVNPAFTRLTGYAADEVRGQNPSILKSGHQPSSVYAALWQTILSGRTWRGEFVNRRKDGSFYTEEASVTPLTDDDGVITHFIAIKQDITERKRAEAAQRESEERYAKAEQLSHFGHWDWDIVHDKAQWSEETYRIFGVSPDQFQVSGEGVMALLHPDDRERTRNALERAVGQGEPLDVEYRVIRPDGTERIVHSVAEVLSDASGQRKRLSGTVHDITERRQAEEEQRRLEEQLRHAQKLEAVGTLAAGIAHDITNLLTAIQGHTELAKRELPADAPAIRSLEVVELAVQEATGVTNSLLTFTHKASTLKTSVDLGRSVTEASRLFRRVLPPSIETVFEIPTDRTVWVRADPTQLQQILMNFAINARDAMPNGGRLRFSVTLETGSASPNTARLSVEDTGSGMTEETKERIFEPFFTTKPRGKGTGLGLSVVHGIVVDHGGRIDVDSQLGQGTRFTIHLPCCEPPEGEAAADPGACAVTAGGEVILLAENNEFVRAIMKTTLEAERWTVVSAADGAEVMKQFAAHEASIRVAVLTNDLPHRRGLDCCRAMRKQRPDLPCILIPGRAEFDLKKADRVRVLNKPFPMSVLTACVTQALAEPVAAESRT